MGQDSRADDLLSSSESDIHLVLPAVCLSEAISAFDWKRIERNRLKDELDKQLKQVTRSTDIGDARQLAAELVQAKLTNDKLLNELFKRLDNYLLSVVNRAELIPVSANIVKEMFQLAIETELDRDDAIILASILAHSSTTTAIRKAFISGNVKDFDKEPVKQLLDQAGITQFSSTENIVLWARAEAI